MSVLLRYSTVSDGNMSFVRGDKEAVIRNRKKFLKDYNINPRTVVFSHLTHSSDVIFVSHKNAGKGVLSSKTYLTQDALITNEKDLFLMLLTADCIPIALIDNKTQAIGLLHASGKNVDTVIANTLQAFQNEFSSQPQDIQVRVGPSIGKCHYEVDLWGKARGYMKNFGIPVKNLENNGICTYEDKNYYSHRRAIKTGDNDFRFATVIGFRS